MYRIESYSRDDPEDDLYSCRDELLQLYHDWLNIVLSRARIAGMPLIFAARRSLRVVQDGRDLQGRPEYGQRYNCEIS